MERFHIIDDGAVILRSRGVYRQAKVYRRGDDVYAGFGAGFIRLTGRGGTSVPTVTWTDVDATGVYVEADGFGRVTCAPTVTQLRVGRG